MISIKTEINNIIQNIFLESLTFYDGKYTGINTNKSSITPSTIIQRLIDKVYKGDSNAFERRIRWSGINCIEFKSQLSYFPQKKIKVLPKWCEVLSTILTDLHKTYDHLLNNVSTQKLIKRLKDEKIPFPELWLPFFFYAQNNIDEEFDSIFQYVSQDAWLDIQTAMIREFSEIGGIASLKLFVLFKQNNSFKYNDESDESDLIYNKFIQYLFKCNFEPFLNEYPFMFRQLSVLLETWISSIKEFLKRYQADQDQIQITFLDGCDLNPIEKIITNLSERHNEGRRVFKIIFKNNKKIIYKPRSVEQEYAFNTFLSWLNKKISVSFPHLKVLSQNGYGWVEFIEHDKCLTKNEVEKYYYLSGGLLFLLYFFHGKDFHMDNIIATKKGPYLIDIESLLHPCGNLFTTDLLQKSYLKKTDQSENVLSSGFLSFSSPSGKFNKIYDISALRGKSGYQTKFLKKVWYKTGKDNIGIEYKQLVAPKHQNHFYCNGNLQLPEYYINSIIDGFMFFYQFFIDKKIELTLHKSPLYLFEKVPIRIMLRSSNDYALIQQLLTMPSNQKKGTDASLLIELLSQYFIHFDEKPCNWSFYIKEIRDILNIDIPYLSISSYKNIIKECFQRLSVKDLHDQEILLRKSLESFAHQKAHIDILSSNNDEKIGSDDIAIKNEIKYQSKYIYNMINDIVIKENFIKTSDKNFKKDQEVYQYLNDLYLYNGKCGILFFLSAYSYVFETFESNELITKYCHSILKTTQEMLTSNYSKKLNLGACNGIGSIIYSFVCIGQMLNNNSIIEYANELAHNISKNKIMITKKFDIEGGTAGLLLSLLSLYEVTKQNETLVLAKICASQLINNSDGNNICRGWKNDDNIMLAGYAHGASGIATSLLRLFKYCKNELYLKTAIQAFNYERGLYSDNHKNWRILHIKSSKENTSNSLFMNSWCHGAPGIFLARMEALSFIDDKETQLDLNNAIEKMSNNELNRVDCLCCGNTGRSDILINGGKKLNKEDLIKKGEDLFYRTVKKAKIDGYFSLKNEIWENIDIHQIGLFKGLAGIGLLMLRILNNRLPAVLSFEPLFDNQ